MHKIPHIDPRKIDNKIERFIAEGQYTMTKRLPDKLVVCPRCGATTRTGVEILNKRGPNGEKWKRCTHCRIDFVQNYKEGWCTFFKKEITPDDCLSNKCGKFPGIEVIKRLASAGIPYECKFFISPEKRMEQYSKKPDDAEIDTEEE